ncbi:hypothetical protein [Sphingobacterium gobiense]|uniref:Phosphatidylinositol diacylglycerol-lyase n=1 Tax=Sphingobacterium gobiense TaxID=1382456 RepID=A0A2S9JTW3_9SPHI|nr:hypothetical protein [Sphingobacterium gobiense]PRD56658.1 hypothetical protein C5749_05335 [Sphingobacterium gobiense]
MGQGSHILIKNQTDQDWVCFHNHQYQMDGWGFPEKIASGAVVKVYVEFCENIFKHEHDDAGEVKYKFGSDTSTNPSSYIEFAATYKHERDVYVKLVNIPSAGNQLNKTIDLGWDHDGTMPFALYGSSGDYMLIDPSRWMEQTLGRIGDFPLKDISIPGSHDAGMYTRNGGTAFGRDCNTLTQTGSVGQQLVNGARYFDIRPVIAAGKYMTGHYSKIIDATWQGANGESISDIIKEVNSFTEGRKEIVILNLSHTLNTDVGNTSYRAFNDEEWTTLFQQLAGINKLLFSDKADLTQVKLNELLSNDSKVIIVVEGLNSGKLGAYYRKGFYTTKEFNVYNSYANTNDLSKMINDQIDKMKAHSDSYFLLSWTLTQSTSQAVTCSSSILDLAKQANAKLDSVLDYVSPSLYPNIVYIDKFDNPLATMVVLEINDVGTA